MTERHQAEAHASTIVDEGLERASARKAPISQIRATSHSTLGLCHSRYLVTSCLSDCRAKTETGVPCLSRSRELNLAAGVNIGCRHADLLEEDVYGQEPSRGMMTQQQFCSSDDCGVASALRKTWRPPRQWKRFSGLMTWLEVTRTSARWWALTGPGNFVAIQVPLMSSDEALFALCIAVDGQTSFRAVFCDPAQCKQSGCPVQSTQSRFEYEIDEAYRTGSDLCPAGVRQ